MSGINTYHLMWRSNVYLIVNHKQQNFSPLPPSVCWHCVSRLAGLPVCLYISGRVVCFNGVVYPEKHLLDIIICYDLTQSLKQWPCYTIYFYLIFREGESFERYCPVKLDELLKEALRLEQHLKNQKERLKERLTLITRTLQMPTV